MLTAGSWTESILYSFTGGLDGSGPFAGVALDANGNILGTTFYGGAHGFGVVFMLSQVDGLWSEAVLFNFRRKSGIYPVSGVTIDKFGNAYGTTSEFGPNKGGTVYELKPSQNGWTLRVLYGFGGVAKHGVLPNAGLALDAAGNLYGTTEFGGDMHCNAPLGCGTVFQISRRSHGTRTGN